MTVAEALVFLGLEAGFDAGELQDALEEQLFELKRFFTSRAPIQKLFQSRLDKLQKIRTALETLDPGFTFSGEAAAEISFRAADILEVYQAYQQENRRLKTALNHSFDPLEIQALAGRLVSLEKQYAGNWAMESLVDEKTLVSKESDPMEVLAAIKAFRDAGGFTSMT